MGDYEVPEHIRKEIEAKEAACRRLEEKFSDIGLKFLMDICGSYPVEAFGFIHGMRFYFRYRGDYAALQVGHYDHERHEKYYERDMKKWTASEAEWQKIIADAGSIQDLPEDVKMDYFLHEVMKPKQETGEEVNALPTLVKKYCSKDNVFDDEYKGDLDPEQAETIFTELVEGLRDIDWRWGEEPFPVEQYENFKK